jgi:hypothetical protein
VTSRYPRLNSDEVGFRLNIKIPAEWGRVSAEQIEVALPEPPSVALQATPITDTDDVDKDQSRAG